MIDQALLVKLRWRGTFDHHLDYVRYDLVVHELWLDSPYTFRFYYLDEYKFSGILTWNQAPKELITEFFNTLPIRIPALELCETLERAVKV
jgi:hypothetical protein